MKHTPFFLTAALLLGCANQTAENSQPLPDPALVHGNNAFAIDLYKTLRTADGNLFFSPLSISSALTMTYAGAKNETAAQMRNALRFQLADADLHPAFGASIRYLNSISKDGGVRLDVVNSLWPHKRYTFLESYLTLLDSAYGAQVTPVDYVQDAESARKQINQWVEGKTNKKITDLLASPPDPSTRMILVNAVYFKGDWALPFTKEVTRPAPFFTAPGKPVNAAMMAQTKTFKYDEDDVCQRLVLPYAGNGQSMLVLLPKTAGPEGLQKLETALDAAKITDWRTSMRPREVVVFLPKFKLIWGVESLKEPLEQLGMKDAFSGAADFSGMDGARDLYLDDVLHKAFVEVNEEGTEAAAATAAVAGFKSAAMPPPVFRADHPFLFLIMDDASGQILFIGRMTDPAQQ